MGEIKDWIPFFSQLVWPTFIVLILFAFREQLKTALSYVIQAVGEGRSLEVGDWLKIGEKTSIAELSKKRPDEVGEDLDISVDSVGGYQDFVEKGSDKFLDSLRKKLQESPNQRIDLLLITAGKSYSTRLLHRYISTLGIRFVVFQSHGKFDGWMYAGLFSSQLPAQDRKKSYEQLKSDLLGVQSTTVTPSDSSVEVLKQMDRSNMENIAVVDGNKFRFIADRGSILSKLLTASLLRDRT